MFAVAVRVTAVPWLSVAEWDCTAVDAGGRVTVPLLAPPC